MQLDEAEQVVALVVLRPESDAVGGQDPITAETLDRHLPAPDDLGDVQAFLAEAGFRVSSAVGVAFSIVGSPSLVQQTFPGFDPAARGEQELSLDALPPRVAAALRAVVIEAPPDFGPGNP